MKNTKDLLYEASQTLLKIASALKAKRRKAVHIK